MRKLILTAALVLISVSAQAGSTRGLIMASNDAPKLTVAEQIKALGPETPVTQTVDAKSDTKTESAAAAAKAEAKVDAKSDAKTESKPEAKAETRSQPKPVSKKRETDEQKARRIAARFGISW